MMVALGYLVLLFLVTFLLGSIPWGVVISRSIYHKDIRNEGSGNIGTTNAMRSLGKVGGAAVFVLDFGKGLLSGVLALGIAGLLAADNSATGNPVLTPLLCMVGFDKGDAIIQATVFATQWSLAVGFAGCVLGHVFSPWLGFKGGKGIAVAIGELFFAFGVAGACIEICIFAVLVIATRYVSVGSVAAAIACPFLALYYYWGDWFAWALFLIVALVVIWAHRANISRLRQGNENRIGAKKKEAQ